nr:hypothetical protein [Nostoc sp. CreGUA01]
MGRWGDGGKRINASPSSHTSLPPHLPTSPSSHTGNASHTEHTSCLPNAPFRTLDTLGTNNY